MDEFLVAFGMESLRDLQDKEQMEDAGVELEPSQTDIY
jgi:segregation and condensation protein B